MLAVAKNSTTTPAKTYTKQESMKNDILIISAREEGW